jgi:hypothetical protein
MKLKALFLAAILVLVGSSFAQSVSDQAAATRIQEKIRRLDLLNNLLPVLLTPEQIGVLVPVLTKARKADEDLKKKEAALLRALEQDLDKAIREGADGKKFPPNELTARVFTTFTAMSVARTNMVTEQVAGVIKVLDTLLDAGQKKAAAGLIRGVAINPAEPDKVTEEQKFRRWVGAILMDPFALDLLPRMARAK